MVAVREDLSEAHRLAWEHLAAPGNWWTGTERVALAGTIVEALLEPDPLPPWVKPSTVDDRQSRMVAPTAAHDFVYRLARHAGTVTEEAARATMAEVGDLPFVELCAITSSVAAVVHFHRNAGVELPPLPDPKTGSPTHEKPDEVVAAALNWVPVAAPADQTAAVLQAYTAVPAELANTWRLGAAQYMPPGEMDQPDWTRRPNGLSRAQMELVAARVAQLRECFY